jgi:UrcA family protein
VTRSAAISVSSHHFEDFRILSDFPVGRHVAKAAIAFAAAATCLASITASAQNTRENGVRSTELDLSAGASRDDLFRRLKKEVKESCRHLSNEREVPFSLGSGNGRVTATRPSQPSPREECVHAGLRSVRVQLDPSKSGDVAS